MKTLKCGLAALLVAAGGLGLDRMRGQQSQRARIPPVGPAREASR